MDGRRADREVARRIGKNLFKARRHAGLSQEAVGVLTGLHRTEVGYVESGRRLPRADTLIKLTSALDVSADHLLAGVEWIVNVPQRPGRFAVKDRSLRRQP